MLNGLLRHSTSAARRGMSRLSPGAPDRPSATLRSIDAVTDPALSFLPADQLLAAVLARTLDAAGGDVASVLVFDEDRRHARVRASVGATELAPVGRQIPLEEGVFAGAASSSRPIVVSDTHWMAGGAAPTPERGIASLAAAPVVAGGAVLGIVGVGSTATGCFDRTDVRLLQVVAERCAVWIQADRLDAETRTTRALVHDLNNLLTVILGCGEALGRAIGAGHGLFDDVSAIRRAGAQAAALASQLLTMGQHSPTPEPQVVDVYELLDAMRPLLVAVLGERVRVEIGRPATRGLIELDRSQIERAVLNLAVNARHAMQDGGRFVVRTGRASCRSGADGVQLSFADTGSGMDTETLARCLDPLSTTKGSTRGGRFGLATVRAAVAQAGGDLHVDSAPGKGTTVTMCFPACDATRTAGSVGSRGPGPVAEVAHHAGQLGPAQVRVP